MISDRIKKDIIMNKNKMPDTHHNNKYSFHKLEKYGDSVTFKDDKSNYGRIARAARAYGLYNGFWITTRVIDGVLNIWRAEDR